MSLLPNDIKDDEIRVISSTDLVPVSGPQKPQKPKKNGHRWIVALSAAVAVLVLLAIVWLLKRPHGHKPMHLNLVTIEEMATEQANGAVTAELPVDSVTAEPEPVKVVEPDDLGYVEIKDTVLNRVPLVIFRPVNLTPELAIGAEALDDSTARFVVQAADIRADNGGIVGAFVNRGELVSRGKAKAGFCAIVNGKMSVGVADSTPLLEQALESDGYFFRQYPLVVGEQLVENKLHGRSLRKALVELNGEHIVVMSRGDMTLHDFAQSLVDLGATNAIYLVGGRVFGFAIDSNGRRTEFGTRNYTPHPNTNYIVWR